MNAVERITSALSSTAVTPNYALIKQRQQATWASGDFAVIGVTLQIVGESLAEAVDVRADERVLDVAAGNGNATLAAARRFAEVTSTDYVPALLDRGADRARAEGLRVTFQPADAEALPFADGSFDAVVSTFGVMFTADHGKAAAEMLRVCRSGGRIGMANWTPEGFIGQLFKTLGRHLPPPAGAKPPSLWGTEAYLKDIFPGTTITATRRHFPFRYRSPKHFVEVFRTWYGPTLKAFAALGDKGGPFEADLISLMEGLDVGQGKGMVVPSEYLEVVIGKP